MLFSVIYKKKQVFIYIFTERRNCWRPGVRKDPFRRSTAGSKMRRPHLQYLLGFYCPNLYIWYWLFANQLYMRILWMSGGTKEIQKKVKKWFRIRLWVEFDPYIHIYVYICVWCCLWGDNNVFFQVFSWSSIISSHVVCLKHISFWRIFLIAPCHQRKKKTSFPRKTTVDSMK